MADDPIRLTEDHQSVLVGDIEAVVKGEADTKDAAAFAAQSMEENILTPRQVADAIFEGFLNAGGGGVKEK